MFRLPKSTNIKTANSTNYKEKLQPEHVKYYEIASKVYEELGPGHTEFIYHRAMEIELREKNIRHESEKRVLIKYIKGDVIYNLGEERIDLYIIDEKLIIELKSIINSPRELEIAQINKYHRELNKDGIDTTYGIIINFPQCGVKTNKEEIDFYEITFPIKK